MQTVRAEKASFWQSNLLQPESPTGRELMKSFYTGNRKASFSTAIPSDLEQWEIRNPQYAMEDVNFSH